MHRVRWEVLRAHVLAFAAFCVGPRQPYDRMKTAVPSEASEAGFYLWEKKKCGKLGMTEIREMRQLRMRTRA